MGLLLTTKYEEEPNLIISSLTEKNIYPFYGLQKITKTGFSFRRIIRDTITWCKVGFELLGFSVLFSGEEECTNCKFKLCIDTTLRKQ